MQKRRLLIGSVAAVAGLALAVHVVRAELTSRRLEREIADLQAQLGARSVPPSASTKRLAARGELVALLDAAADLRPEDEFVTKPIEIWAPAAPDAEYRAGLRARLARYQPLFDGLDRLPASVWEDRFALPAPEPDEKPLWRYRRLRVATSALCARAWLEAQEPGGAELAGRSLGRALALARVTDDGLTTSFGMRAFLEGRVVESLEATRAVAFETSDCLTSPVRLELERSLAEDRFRICLVNEAQRFVDGLRAARGSGVRAWFSDADESEVALAYLAWYGELLDSPVASASEAGDGERCAYPRRGDDHAHNLWRSMTALDFRRRTDLAEALRAN